MQSLKESLFALAKASTFLNFPSFPLPPILAFLSFIPPVPSRRACRSTVAFALTLALDSMAEILGIIASAIALGQGIGAVTKGMQKIASARNAPVEFLDLHNEVCS